MEKRALRRSMSAITANRDVMIPSRSNFRMVTQPQAILAARARAAEIFNCTKIIAKVMVAVEMAVAPAAEAVVGPAGRVEVLAVALVAAAAAALAVVAAAGLSAPARPV